MLKITPYASSSKGNLYLLENDKTKILLECGVNEKEIRKYLRGNGLIITDLNACITTHAHADHSLSIDYVSDYIAVYSTRENKLKHFQTNEIEPKSIFKIGTIKILAIPVEHGKTENFAFVFMDKESCLFFGTDFSLMEQNVSNFKFDKIYIEANYDDDMIQEALDSSEANMIKHIRQVSTHMSKENCKEHLRNMDLSKCKEIILLHPSAFLINKEKIKHEFEKEFKIKTYFAKEK